MSFLPVFRDPHENGQLIEQFKILLANTDCMFLSVSIRVTRVQLV